MASTNQKQNFNPDSEIWNTGEEFQHETSNFHYPLEDDSPIVRGFTFNFTTQEVPFRVVILDGGNSRRYWDSMNEERKNWFIKRFAYSNLRKLNSFPWRADWLINYHQLPIEFVAFLSDNGSSLSVDTLVPRYPLANIFR